MQSHLLRRQPTHMAVSCINLDCSEPSCKRISTAIKGPPKYLMSVSTLTLVHWTSAYSFSRVSQSARLMRAKDESKSVEEFGSKLSRSCSQINGVLSTVSGLWISVGWFSHWCHAFRKLAVMTAWGSFSGIIMLPPDASSYICFSNACG